MEKRTCHLGNFGQKRRNLDFALCVGRFFPYLLVFAPFLELAILVQDVGIVSAISFFFT